MAQVPPATFFTERGNLHAYPLSAVGHKGEVVQLSPSVNENWAYLRLKKSCPYREHIIIPYAH